MTTGAPSVVDHADPLPVLRPGAVPRPCSTGWSRTSPWSGRSLATSSSTTGRPGGPPGRTAGEIGSRWVSAILGHDQERHPEPLSVPRTPTTRVQGCCRDFALVSVAILRAA